MGAYKYIGELYKKKQSDVLRFLLRVRYVAILNYCCCWIYPDRGCGTAVGSTAS
jgi:hypothetical protein